MTRTSIGRGLAALTVSAALLAGCGSNDDGRSTNTAAAPASGAPSAPVASSAAASADGAADNGVAALEPSEIVSRARAALQKAKSFRVKGSTVDDGQQITIDLKVSNVDVGGVLSLGGAKVQLLRVAGKQYIKPNKAFWKLSGGKQADQIVEVVGDRWVKVPANDKNFGSLFAVTDIKNLIKPEGTVTKGGTKTFAGTPAIGLVDHGSEPSTLYVATAGEPYPLAIEGKADADSLTFSDFGTTFADVKAPSAADVLDLGKLKG
jgi:hypothetical protein